MMSLKICIWIVVASLDFGMISSCLAEPLTVSQLRSDIEKQQSAQHSDKSIAEQLSTVHLSEELTRRTLDDLSKEFRLGPKTAAALDFLSAQSALLDPPQDEIIDRNRPDDPTCAAMFRAVAEFASVSLHHMPDFIATRSTQSWDDAPPPPNPVTGFVPAFVPIHPTGSYEENITYRQGREVGLDSTPRLSVDTQARGSSGFTSRGEFGPMLRLILSDTLRSRLQWRRWEMISGTEAAVFHYEVPEPESKFRLNFCCVAVQRGRNGLEGTSVTGNNLFFGGNPAYEGEIYIDPAGGAIRRMTVRTILDRSNPIRRAGLAIEYGPVEIGGKTYICPIRSVADATVRISAGDAGERTIRHINRVDFVRYRRFGSESRIVTAGSNDP